MNHHGLKVGGLDGKLYVVFDPRWFQIRLWIWWWWHLTIGKLISTCFQRFFFVVQKKDDMRRVETNEVQLDNCNRWAPSKLVTAQIELRIGNQSKRVRVYRDSKNWFVWTPPTKPIPRPITKFDVQPDVYLPPGEVHPNERGL